MRYSVLVFILVTKKHHKYIKCYITHGDLWDTNKDTLDRCRWKGLNSFFFFVLEYRFDAICQPFERQLGLIVSTGVVIVMSLELLFPDKRYILSSNVNNLYDDGRSYSIVWQRSIIPVLFFYFFSFQFFGTRTDSWLVDLLHPTKEKSYVTLEKFSCTINIMHFKLSGGGRCFFMETQENVNLPSPNLVPLLGGVKKAI